MATSTNMKNLKCANCSCLLKNASQLPACLHIFCGSCMIELERRNKRNVIYCPKCDKENVNQKTLQLISGFADTLMGSKVCDACEKEKQPAVWNCFDCGQNLCLKCRGHHSREHNNLMMLPTNVDLTRAIFNASPECNERLEVTDCAASDNTDHRSGTNLQCPLCVEGSASCEHMTTLLTLKESRAISCEQLGHIECDGTQKKLKYFCKNKDCWIPVCGSCSKEGEHKLHETIDLIKMARYFNNNQELLLGKAKMLSLKCKMNAQRGVEIEKSLSDHVSEISILLHQRKYKVIEDASKAFERAISDAEKQGVNIVTEYRENLDMMRKFESFLEAIIQEIGKIEVSDREMEGGDVNVLKYIMAFDGQRNSKGLLDSLDAGFKKVAKTDERRLVLMDTKKDLTTIVPPLPFAKVGTEWAQLKEAFHFKLHHEAFYASSVVVTASDECLISCQMSGNSDYDAIIYHHLDQEVKCDVIEGKYQMSRMRSGEIVATYSNKANKIYSVQYCDGNKFQNLSTTPSILELKDINNVSYEATGIATTRDNNILVCLKADDGKLKSQGLRFLMKMTLQGKVLKSTEQVPGRDIISPDYVAVSDEGEICIADTEGSSVVILNQDLDIIDRMNFSLSTNLDQSTSLPFKPHGICYDSYGRIIVADTDNHSVVRLYRDHHTQNLRVEPLLTKTSNGNLSFPKLVAFGPDSRLWVICREYVNVFDYCP